MIEWMREWWWLPWFFAATVLVWMEMVKHEGKR